MKNSPRSIIVLILLMTPLLLASLISRSQNYSELTALGNAPIKTFCSKGADARAMAVAERCRKAIVFYQPVTGFTPELTILVLDPKDWAAYALSPVYGMPHYDNKKLVVASEDNTFWQSFIPLVDKLTPAAANKVKRAYMKEDGRLSMQAFFDLLALHELAHAYPNQQGINVQRLWMGELISNIFLHTYIAEEEPGQLDALTTFPDMVVAAGEEGYLFTTLAHFEKNYDLLGMKHPNNYGWYQCRLHVAARQVYDASGKAAFTNLMKALKAQNVKLTDEELVNLLRQQVGDAMADVMVNW